MTEQQSQNLLIKVDPLSTIRNNKLITQGEKLETAIAKVRVFVSNKSSPPSKRRYKRYGFSYFFVIHVGGLHVFNKNLPQKFNGPRLDRYPGRGVLLCVGHMGMYFCSPKEYSFSI